MFCTGHPLGTFVQDSDLELTKRLQLRSFSGLGTQSLISPTSNVGCKRILRQPDFLLKFLNRILENDEVVTEMRRVAKVVRRGPNTTTKADGTTKQEKPVTQLETRTRATNLEWLFDESSGYEVTRRVLRFQLVARNDRDDIINIELLRAAQPFSIDRL
ncbi:hypothetical protein H4Q26_013026 [Puccinia striiformis f. sp. tritici PST-130]|uniref:Uncharacterized protein n=1 Tax=Puccinia striiformis f. sp. tritici PST-78 TaxID=1165861 RepID=A0A0L0W0M2_9BASI|nr:hypothetical protein H4Q26_013026 [Puccinia striiformis f. sp. tritici PST-130]KNF05002.1 hypothetical protein PSTG_02058 [Puccinia striiformis f. sp. tritici PST-78]